MPGSEGQDHRLHPYRVATRESHMLLASVVQMGLSDIAAVHELQLLTCGIKQQSAIVIESPWLYFPCWG